MRRVWMTTKEAARYCGCGESIIRKAASSGELRSGGIERQPGMRRWRFCPADLDEWMHAHSPLEGKRQPTGEGAA